MDSKNSLIPLRIKVVKSANIQADKLIKEQLNPGQFHKSRSLRKDLVKKIKKSVYIDSSYYLG